MNTTEQSFLEYLEDEYDVNNHLDFYEDQQTASLEVNAPGLFVTIELLTSCLHGSEEGGEPDEVLATITDKNVEVTELIAWTDPGTPYQVSAKFKLQVENKINDLLYD